MAIHTTHTRDAAMRQLQRMNRWVIGGSVLLTGVLSGVAANAFPGKTKVTAASREHKHRAGTSTGVLKPPAEAPKAAIETPSSAESATQEPTPQVPAESSEPAPVESSEPAEATESAPSEPHESAPAEPQETAPQEPTPEAAGEGPVVSGGS